MDKYANLIIVGGTIAAGKSTLVNSIAKKRGFFPSPELRKDDKVQEIILQKLYEGTRMHKATIQCYFLSNRYKQYKEESQTSVTSILDRGIWEDWFFALLLMEDEQKSYEHYKKLWKKTIVNMIDSYGKPKVYIYLKIDWNTFKERIFSRNRKAEISNFDKNKKYFKQLLNEYDNNFINLLNDSNIKTIVMDTVKLSKEEVFQKTLQELDKLGI